jgi:GTP-dependent phosphoenolpyruvate carboxykinase
VKREATEGGRQGERETGYMCDDEQNESTGRSEAWSVGSTYKEKAIGTKGKIITVRRRETRTVTNTGQLNEHATVLSITY